LHEHQKVYKHFEEVLINTEELPVTNINTQNSEISVSNDYISDCILPCNVTVVFEHSGVAGAARDVG